MFTCRGRDALRLWQTLSDTASPPTLRIQVHRDAPQTRVMHVVAMHLSAKIGGLKQVVRRHLNACQ